MVTQPSFYLAAVPAVILLGLSKGGFAGLSVLGMPLMALTIPPVQAAAITLPILIVQDMVSVWTYRRSWDRANLKILLPGAAAGILLAFLLTVPVPTRRWRCPGVIAVVALRRFVGGRRPERRRLRTG